MKKVSFILALIVLLSVAACASPDQIPRVLPDIPGDSYTNGSPQSNAVPIPSVDIGISPVSSGAERWEYKVVIIDGFLFNTFEASRYEERSENSSDRRTYYEYDVAEINRMGAEGWELVNTERDSSSSFRVMLFFKRRLQ